jgi:hypothetical protein
VAGDSDACRIDFLVGDEFERIAPLGEHVYRCRNRRTGQEVVWKTISPHSTDPEKTLRRVVLHSSVVHKRIAAFVGVAVSSEATGHIEYYPNRSVLGHREVSNTTKMIWIYGIAFGMNLLH